MDGGSQSHRGVRNPGQGGCVEGWCEGGARLYSHLEGMVEKGGHEHDGLCRNLVFLGLRVGSEALARG